MISQQSQFVILKISYLKKEDINVKIYLGKIRDKVYSANDNL